MTARWFIQCPVSGDEVWNLGKPICFLRLILVGLCVCNVNSPSFIPLHLFNLKRFTKWRLYILEVSFHISFFSAESHRLRLSKYYLKMNQKSTTFDANLILAFEGRRWCTGQNMINSLAYIQVIHISIHKTNTCSPKNWSKVKTTE